MNKAEIRRLVGMMEFFYGFLFGVAIFGAVLTFLVLPSFLIAILLAVCVFAFFIFLMLIVRYCIIRIKIAQQTLEIQAESYYIQSQAQQSLLDKDKAT